MKTRDRRMDGGSCLPGQRGPGETASPSNWELGDGPNQARQQTRESGAEGGSVSGALVRE